MAANAAPASLPTPHPTRAFGRFELRQLLGKSSATMAWLAVDTRSARELVLHMPRVQPTDASSLETWLHEARMAARLNHPHLAPVAEIGVQDHWPYLAVERGQGLTLGEWLQVQAQPAPLEAVDLLYQALEGLAFAHDSGVVHQDLQFHHLLVDDLGHVRVAALGTVLGARSAGTVVGAPAAPIGVAGRAQPLPSVLDPAHLRVRRDAAERDVLSIGVLLHHLLAGAPALEQADTGLVIARLPPHGRETIRLPWVTPHPVTEALRVIVNRATARQPRQRYLNARTLLRALEGWREAAALDGGGPLALLLDRLGNVGHLPALPGVGALAAGLAMLEGEHTREMTEPILRDMALSFELLRQVNTAQVQGTQVAGNGPVLTIRRTVALVGVNGVRQAAAALRAWPGPLNEAGAAALKQLMDRVRLAGHAAQALRPPGYDAEVVYLIALLQNLGRLMIQYHFVQEAAQVSALMQPTPAAESDDAREHPGMSEEAASYAVLGVDVESLGAAVARHWGLNDEVLHMIRRLPLNRPVRSPDGDGDLLRMAASAANEAIDAITQLPAAKVGAALGVVVQRYGRGLGITLRDLNDALHSARVALQGHVVVTPAQAEVPEPPADLPPREAAPSQADSPAATLGAAF